MSDRPDWTQNTQIQGHDGAQLRTVKVDTDGQMFSLMKGLFGVTYKGVAVDTNGQMIVILKGASGNDVLVDANGFMNALMKGFDGTNYQSIKTDTSGNMLSIMKGFDGTNLQTLKVDAGGNLVALIKALYGAAETPLKCDTDGNLFLNLKEQDLAQMTQRPKYGALTINEGSLTVDSGTKTTFVEITGKGNLYFGNAGYTTINTANATEYWVEIDGVETGIISDLTSILRGTIFPYSQIIYPTCVMESGPHRHMAFGPNITFESSLKLKTKHYEGIGRSFFYKISSAVV